MEVRPAFAIAVSAALLASGCGASTHDQVHSKVEEFAVAVAHKDAKTICNDVFAPSLVAHFTAAGLTCVRGMGIFFAGLHNPTLAVGPITVRGSRASVVTLSGASGQTAAVRSVNLVDTSDGWRIASLGSSPTSAKAPSKTTPTTAPKSHRPTKTSSKRPSKP
jgi:hypothetical protein